MEVISRLNSFTFTISPLIGFICRCLKWLVETLHVKTDRMAGLGRVIQPGKLWTSFITGYLSHPDMKSFQTNDVRHIIRKFLQMTLAKGSCRA